MAKSVAEVAVSPFTVTVILPEVAPDGTVVVNWIAEEVLTLAVVPLNFTTLSEVVGLKLVPAIVTVVVIGPDGGEKEVIVGGG
jgi:hypothetical protein